MSLAFSSSGGSPQAIAAPPVLNAYVNYADMVPEALFGAWQRTRHIEKSSASDMVDRTEEGAWVIYRDGNRIFLRNPDNGAETEVEVEKVMRETAVFHYTRQLAQGNWCQEQLTLSATDEEHLQGFQVKECYRREGQSYYYAFARVNGTRQRSLPPIR